jgi:hypothetical protein
MADAPERILVAVSERGDLAINSKGEKLNGYAQHETYIRADAVAALVSAAVDAERAAHMTPDDMRALADAIESLVDDIAIFRAMNDSKGKRRIDMAQAVAASLEKRFGHIPANLRAAAIRAGKGE